MEAIGQLITQAMELKQPALVLTPSGLTATLQVAINSKTIGHCDFSEIQKPLAYCMMLVGIKGQNIPQNEDAAFLIGQIKKNFGGNRLNEIQLAFDLAVNGQLDIEEKEVNAYQDFTFIYFSRIFNAYRRWAAVEYKQIQEKPVQKIYTLEELDNFQRADIEAFYQRILKGSRETAPDYFLPLLIKDGYLGEGSDDLSGFFSYWIGRGYKNIYVTG